MSAFKTLRLKVRPESNGWLSKAAREVNTVWNWANETSDKAIRRYVGPAKFLTGYDLDKLASGGSSVFSRLSADSISRINALYACRRRVAKRTRLSWRTSNGPRRSLGWVPFKGVGIKRKGNAIRYYGKTFRVFQADRLDGAKLGAGCFAEDSCGDWWFCVSVAVATSDLPAPHEAVGIDLGLKDTATTSDGDKLVAGNFYRNIEQSIAMAQRRGHKRQSNRLHRKAANRRKDALHKFTRTIVNKYQKIVIGDIRSAQLTKTRMAKSVLDAGWYALKTQLQYKGQQAGRCVQVVNESYTSRACSGCGCLSGPAGLDMLDVRHWTCADCGESHDRDVNAARNILRRAEASVSVSGNEARKAANADLRVAGSSHLALSGEPT